MQRTKQLDKMSKPVNRTGRHCRDRTQAFGVRPDLGQRGTAIDDNQPDAVDKSAIQTKARSSR